MAELMLMGGQAGSQKNVAAKAATTTGEGAKDKDVNAKTGKTAMKARVPNPGTRDWKRDSTIILARMGCGFLSQCQPFLFFFSFRC